MPIASVIVTYRKRLFVVVASLATALSLVFTSTASAITVGGPSDCDSNAIIRCGAHSTTALQQAYNADPYVQKVFAHFGVSRADMANLDGTNVGGRVTRDGRVFINSQSQPVATGAVTGGRQNMPGSTRVNANGAVFYKRPPSASFQQASLPAFVAMKNGRFQFAVIASCGNAVRAVPTEKPKAAVGPARPVSKAQPKPQPKPQPAPSQSQVQSQQQSQGQSQEVNVNNSNTQNVQTTSPTPQQSETTTETVTTTQAPTETAGGKLPDTGAAGAAGVFLGSVGLGTWGYRRFLLRHLAN